MYHDIQSVLTRLVRKAGQLIGNETTNIAESWMHIRSKYDGGKVINRSQSGSWEHRCMGAGLQQNMGKQWGPAIWRDMTNSLPNEVYTDTAERSAKNLKRDNERIRSRLRDVEANMGIVKTTQLQLAKHTAGMTGVFHLTKLMMTFQWNFWRN